MTIDLVRGVSFFVLVPVFLYAIYISLKFQWGAEGKDERGQTIINKAYMAAAPVFPIGWLIENIFSDFIYEMPYEGYRTFIWILVLLTFIIHGLMISYHKRTM